MFIYSYICVYIYIHYYYYCFYSSRTSAIASVCGVPPPPSSASQPKRAPSLGCDFHTFAPAKTKYTNFIMHPFVLRVGSTNSLGHGHGHECLSPVTASLVSASIVFLNCFEAILSYTI